MGLDTLGSFGAGGGGGGGSLGLITAIATGQALGMGLPPSTRADVQVFRYTGLVGAPAYQVWRKPANASLVFMLTVADGGGGGGGFSRATGNPGGGGGSGACSGIQRFHCPAICLPDTLHVQVGAGGQGGAAGAPGTAGANSYIVTSGRIVAPTLPNIICYSGVNAPGGGQAGAAGGGGAAGTVPTISVAQPWHTLGDASQTVGLVGVIGGAQTGAAGTAVTAWAALPFSPGASGGGSTGPDFAGGALTATALLDLAGAGQYPSGAGNLIAGGVANGGNGGAGVSQLEPLLSCGGSGGGTNDDGQAGDGGPGGIGSGGGGGGAGTTGGRGGRGGDGIVIIISI